MTMTELSPNAEMTMAMSSTAPEYVTKLATRMESLDMSATADDAYEQAVISAAHRMGINEVSMFHGDPSSSTSGAMLSTSVAINNHEDFLRLLTRFHQAVTPLPKSISMSFGPPSSSSSKGTGFPPRSKVYYCPTRSYSRPNNTTSSGMPLTRRRTSSAPSLTSSSTSRVTIPLVFNDMESLLSKANEMVDVMRSDLEDTMQKHRKRDRKAREQERMSRSLSIIDEDEDEIDDAPLLRKVPVSSQPSWYSSVTFPPVQDPSMLAARPIITPRRLRPQLATITEVTEPGEEMAPDAIEKCTSRLTSLRIEDAPAQPKRSNPIRMYVGYNRVTRPPFKFGTDTISTQNTFEMAL